MRWACVACSWPSGAGRVVWQAVLWRRVTGMTSGEWNRAVRAVRRTSCVLGLQAVRAARTSTAARPARSSQELWGISGEQPRKQVNCKGEPASSTPGRRYFVFAPAGNGGPQLCAELL